MVILRLTMRGAKELVNVVFLLSYCCCFPCYSGKFGCSRGVNTGFVVAVAAPCVIFYLVLPFPKKPSYARSRVNQIVVVVVKLGAETVVRDVNIGNPWMIGVTANG